MSPRLCAFVMLSCAADALPLEPEEAWQRFALTITALTKAHDSLAAKEQAAVKAHPDWSRTTPLPHSTWFD